MDHILTGWNQTTGTTIWNSAEELWLYEEGTWPRISLRVIIGCNILNVETTREVKDRWGQTQTVKRNDRGVRGPYCSWRWFENTVTSKSIAQAL